MMRRGYILAIAAASMAGGAWADRVYLDNGDRLSGAVMSLEGGVLTLESDYAGAVAVPAAHILALETERPVTLRLHDGVIWTGVLSVGEEGRQTLLTEDQALVLQWEDVAAIARDRAVLEDPPALEAGLGAEEPEKWGGAVEAGANWRSGETDTTGAHASLALSREWEKHTVSLGLKTAYGEVESEVNTRQISGELKWKYFPKERLFLFAVGSGEHDPGRRLNLRASGGLGAGYDVWNQEARKLSLDAGLDYTKEWWERYSLSEERRAREQARIAVFDQIETVLVTVRNDPNPLRPENIESLIGLVGDYRETRFRNPVTDEEKVSLRFGLSYEQTLFNRATLTEELVVLPSMKEGGEYRANSVLALATPLSESLDLRVSLRTEYDSDPGTGASEWDNTLITSVRYGF